MIIREHLDYALPDNVVPGNNGIGLREKAILDRVIPRIREGLPEGLKSISESILAQYIQICDSNPTIHPALMMNNLLNLYSQAITKYPTMTGKQFENWFMGKSEGIDGDYDAAYWDDPNLTFPQQNLPSYANFSANFPYNSDPRYDSPQKMYNSIGGNVATLYSGPNTNTCAVRLSQALNYSGVIIPNLPGKTFEGADGKYYFKAAYEINLWMRATFGTNPASTVNPKTPYNPNHVQYSQAQAGEHGVNLPGLLLGKQGIYSIYSSNFQWATGHADLLKSDATCGNQCHFYDAPIYRLDVWILN